MTRVALSRGALHCAPCRPLRGTAVVMWAALWVALLGACASGSGGGGKGPGPGPGAGTNTGTKPPATSASARVSGPIATLRCGKQEITVRTNAEQAELTVGAKRYLLQAQRSASGARYASSAYPGTSYWSRGDSGMLMVDGQAYPECIAQAAAMPVVASAEGAPPRDLTVREWVVESIEGRGVVDNSRTTLMFDPKGQISGRSGCNRYTGSYRLQGAQFSASGVASTRMVCVPPLMDQEQRFLKALAGANTWRLQPDGSLVLTGPGGRKLLAR